jgi:hypothetical protein
MSIRSRKVEFRRIEQELREAEADVEGRRRV